MKICNGKIYVQWDKCIPEGNYQADVENKIKQKIKDIQNITQHCDAKHIPTKIWGTETVDEL